MPAVLDPVCLSSNLIYMIKDREGWNTGKPLLLRLNLEKAENKTIWHYEVSPKMNRTAFVMRGGERRTEFKNPWDRRLVYAVASKFVAVTYSDSREIQILDHDGNLKRTFRFKMPVRELSQEHVDELLSYWPPEFRAKLLRVERPEEWLAVSAIFIDGENRIWLTGSGESTFRNFNFAVFSAEGARLGQGLVKFRPQIIHKHALYYQIEDADGQMIIEKATYSF